MCERPQKFNDWVMVRRLGKGTYGEVNLWRHQKTKQQVAVKKCPLKAIDADEKKYKMKERWEKELAIMQSDIKNDYIVSAVRVDSTFLDALNNPKDSILPALVMEYCDGGDLRTLLYDIKNSNGLIETEVKNVLRTLCGAISYLHSFDITHRDLKPENIVIKKGQDGNIFKVTDFGYAKDIVETCINSQVGTIGYFAPEIILLPKYSKTVDFWSMGIVAFEVICGVRPFIPHQHFKNWIETVKEKSDGTIAVTETKDNKFEEHNRVFDEHQISGLFRGMIESWLKIALDINPRRGCTTGLFGAPNEVQSTFFTDLESILNKKILTMFCLPTYTFLDYEVTENMFIPELLMQIERDTNIPLDKIYLILTPHHTIDFQIQKNTKATDLIVDNIDGPMVYVCGTPEHFLNIKKTMMVEAPKVIADALDSTNQKFQIFYILELARKILFLARNENRHYVHLLKGLHTYAMILNHQICKFEFDLENINEQEMFGALGNCLCLLNHSKKRLEEKRIIQADFVSAWEAKTNQFRGEIIKLVDACKRTRLRYKSVLRRSKDIYDSQMLKDTEKDFFDVAAREKEYASLRDKRENPLHKSDSDRIRSLVNAYYEIVQQRTKLLEDPSIRQVEANLADIHKEFGKIREITKNASYQVKKYCYEIQQLTCDYYDDIWRVVEQTAEDSKNIQDVDSMMSSLKIDQIQNGAPTLDFQLGSIQSTSQMDVCSLISCETRSIIEENEYLMQSLQTARINFCSPDSTASSP